jgi:hypothetical protein
MGLGSGYASSKTSNALFPSKKEWDSTPLKIKKTNGTIGL